MILNMPGRWIEGVRARGIDGATTYATVGHLVSLCLGPVTALLVATRLDSITQGYYYTFGSLTAVQVLFGAGLNQVLMQVASHEWARLTLDRSGRLVGDKSALQRVRAILCLAVRWYGGMALVFGLSLIVLGWLVFSARIESDGVVWLSPWLAISILSCVNFAITPVWAVLQGCGQIRQYYGFHAIHLVLNAIALWIGLSAGLALWAPPLATSIGVLWSAGFLSVRYGRFFCSMLDVSPDASFSWTREVWPLQWRSWVSWVASTLTPQALVPITFRLVGPTLAGQLGMTLTLTTVVAAIGSNPISTKAPQMGALVATRQFTELNRLYRRALSTSASLLAASIALLMAFLLILGFVANPLVKRIMPAPSLLALLVAASGLAVAGWLAAYVRAFKREPFARAYLSWSLGTLGAAAALAPDFGATGVVIAYVIGVVAFLLPMTFSIYRKYGRTSCGTPPLLHPATAAQPSGEAARNGPTT